MANNISPSIIFLGFCERAAYVSEGNTNLLKWNILGLKNVLLSNIFPISLNGSIIGLAIDQKNIRNEQKLKLTDDNNNELGIITLDFSNTKQGPLDIEDELIRDTGPWVGLFTQGWTTIFVKLVGINVVIMKPGVYHISLITEEGSCIIGEILFALIDPPPLTTERIAAIKSEPGAAKYIRIELGCNKCPSKFRAYTSLERSADNETKGWQWYESIPDNFECECGCTKIDLTIIRRNLHCFLGRNIRERAELNFIPLYEKSALEKIRRDFLRLINSNPIEELIQKYINENPILLHQFPSEKLFAKPPILTFFNADFGIVTPQKELILIELEKTTTRLIKKDGGIAAQLSHAFDQVRDWLHTTDEHRLAVLYSLKIEKEMVSLVRGVVIAGRDMGYDANHMRRLKGSDWGRITLLTYDDLLFSLDALIRRMDKL
jgi:hypothetical protein